MRILAIDPGTTKSAYVVFDTYANTVSKLKGINKNQELLSDLNNCFQADLMAIEFIQSYGMPVGREVFETIYWSGKFALVAEQKGVPVKRVGRQKVKSFVTGIPRAKDKDVRQALMLIYGGSKKGEPLEGVKKDIWAALAVAHYVKEAIKVGKLEEW